MLYKENMPDTANNLYAVYDGEDTFVNSITYPWVEIKDLYSQNLPYDTAILTFQSCSSTEPIDNNDALLNWPHSIWLYMQNRDGVGHLMPRLGTNDSAKGIFNNQAADVGGMCPPRCGIYVQPHNFPMAEFLKSLVSEKLIERITKLEKRIKLLEGKTKNLK